MAFTIKDLNVNMSAEQSRGDSKLTVTREMKITPMSAMPEVFDTFLGGFRKVGRRIVRIPAMRHPLFRWARCTKIDAKPFDVLKYNAASVIGAGQINKYAYADSALVTATYSLPDITESDEQESGAGQGDEEQEIDLCSESWDYSYKNLTLPAHYMKWQSSDEVIRPDELAAYLTQPVITCTIVRHRVLNKPIGAILALLGKINGNELRLVSDRFPVGTVRFDGLQANRRLTTAKGLQYFELSYKFMATGNYGRCADLDGASTWAGWNRAFNPKTAMYDRIVWAADETRQLFEYDDEAWTTTIGGRTIEGFSNLFHPLAT